MLHIKKYKFFLIVLTALVVGLIVGGAITDSIKQTVTIYKYTEPPKVRFI